MQPNDLADTSLLDLGFLIARVMIGLLMAAHGAQKLFGWFGGHGLKATGEFMGQLGFRPARLFATSAALGELASGVLIAVGLLGPAGPAIEQSLNAHGIAIHDVGDKRQSGVKALCNHFLRDVAIRQDSN